MTTVTMPDSATIVERLKSVMDEGSNVARFYASFAKTGGATLNQGGVYLQWQLSLSRYTSDPMGIPMFGALIMMNFEDYMNALFPDNPDFVQAIMDWHNEVTEELKR